MGTIIGRQGIKIKHIQDVSGARMTAQKEMLPQSTERVVQVEGDAMAIRMAIWEIGKCLVDDWARGTGTILYNPVVRAQGGSITASNGGMGHSAGERPERTERNSARSYARTGNGADFSDAQPSFRRSDAPAPRSIDRASPSDAPVGENGEEHQTQHIPIPADMVGCIIGRGGTKIQEIRRTSGARISIAKAPHDDSGERMFTITGTGVSNEKALFMLYENLEAEKTRRAQGNAE
jgi:heterogeneous nuclear rnp K-like protein 2